MSSPQPARGGRRPVAVVGGLLLVIGLVVLGAVALGQRAAPPEAPRTTGAVAPSDPSDGGHDAPAATPAPSPEGTEGEGGGSASQGAEDQVAAMDASEPTRVRVPAHGIDAPVFPIALAEDGTLPAPSGERADDAAWFEGSPTPGEDGPAVIEGHVTYSGDPSVFFDLGAVEPGDRIEVDRADGSTAVFEVHEITRVPKDEFPTWAVYGNTEGPELRMITCGGEVDEDGRHQDNVLVHAHLVDA